MFQKGHKNFNKVPPMLGKKFSEEHKRKLSIAHKGKNPHIWTTESKKKASESRMGIKLSKETRERMSRSRMGNKHWNWQGGKSFIKRYIHHTSTLKYNKWRSDVFARDNWICKTCGARSKAGEPVYLEAHHIKSWAKYPKLRYKIDNGITLCKECHKLIHKL